MKNLLFNSLRKKKKAVLGEILFLTGIFLLPSTLFISILFLLPSAIIGSFLQKKSFLLDNWNKPFLIFGVLIIMSALLQNFVLKNNYIDIWNPMLSIVGVGNWIPFIWFFWAFQPFLDSKEERRLFALTLISGTLPVLITGFGQYFFNWNGPFETLNGLIIWYQKPIENPGGLSGLFNHQNYAGSWLIFIWPFCLALILEKRNDLLKKLVEFCFLIFTGLAAFLTYSRNAWIGLIVSLPIMIGKKGFNLLLAIIPIISLTFLLIFSTSFKGHLLDSINNFLPDKFLLEFAPEGYEGLDATRFEIFLSAINLIKSNPFFGIGAASFSKIYQLETTFWKGHAHNLPLELAVSYGLPAAIILCTTIIIIIFISGKIIFSKQRSDNISIFDRAFWIASSFFIFSQLYDIQYFDGKISIIAWILIAGLKNVIENQSYYPLINRE